MKNVKSIFDLSVQTTKDLSEGSWPSFLKTAAWNYKYLFPNQVLIFAQRPDATACASMQVWNEMLHRRVNAGAAGIALLEDAGEQMRLNYIFDVSDTNGQAPVPIWNMTAEKEEDVRIDLVNLFLPGSHPFRDDVMAVKDATLFYYEISHYLCDQFASSSLQELLEVKDACEGLRDFSDDELEFEYLALLNSSVTAILMYRCGLEPDIDPGIWESAKRFSDPASMAILGQTTQSLAMQGLEVVRKAVRNWDRTHKEEKQHENKSELSAGRAVSNSGAGASEAGGSEPVREAAQAVPAGAQAQSVYPADADRRADGAPEQYRPADREADRLADGGTADSAPGAGQDTEQREMDAAHDPAAVDGGRDGLSGDDLQLIGAGSDSKEFEPILASFPTPAEQDAVISAALSDLALTQDEVEFTLSQIIEEHGKENDLLASFRNVLNFDEGAAALRDIFAGFYGEAQLGFGGPIGFVSAQSYGIDVSHLDKHHIVPWREFAAYFQKEVAAGRFEKAQVPEQPVSSDQLKENQVILLAGKQYRVIGLSTDMVSLQDVDYPIFSNSMPRSVLDILLRNNTPGAHTAPPQIPSSELSGNFPQAVENSRSSEPYMDHPELIAKDASRNARIDKVVLTDLLMHFINYRSAYAEQVLELSNDGLLDPSEHDLQAYQQERVAVEEMSAAGTPEENRQKLQEVVAFFNRWFVPFSELTSEHIQKDMNHVLDAAMDAMERWEQLDFEEGDHTPASVSDVAISESQAEDAPEEEVAEKFSVKHQEPSLFDFSFEPSVPADAVQASEPVPVNAVPSAEPSDRSNFQFSDEENLGGPKARFQNNIAAIRLLKELEEQDRLADPEEQKILSRYVGWGGLSNAFDKNIPQWHEEYTLLKELLTEEEYVSARESTLTAFYTPPAVTEAIYTGLRQLGFQSGNILDPCCGTGNFFGSVPADMQDSKLFGVELDSLSGRIARQLYQNANIVIEGYEKTSLPDSMFDVAVGNVPFGNIQLPDRRYDKEHFLIHDYFFAKTLDKVRPGGIIAFVTSKGTMDKKNDAVRRYIAHRADLLGAIRLPDNTFKTNAGTDVTSDILFLRKREHPTVEEPSWVGLGQEYRGYDPETGEVFLGPEINAYFAENPQMVLGDLVEVSGPHGPVLTCRAREGEDLRDALQKAVKNIHGTIGNVAGIEALDEPEHRHSIPADPDIRNFSFAVVDGDVYYREDSRMFKCELNRTAEQRVKGMVKIRDITRDLINAQLENAPDARIESLQNLLNTTYDAFTAKYGIINSRANEMAFSDDSAYYLLCSLENLDNEGNFIGKADMFHKRTIGHHSVPEHVETAQEALAVSLGERAGIDLEYMSQLSDLSREQLIEDLQGLIFPVPGEDNRHEIASLYLSGNVRQKLAEAKKAAETDARFAFNVSRLEQVMPEPLGPSDISVRIGSTWVPPEIYKDFIIELLNAPEYCRNYVDVKFEPHTGYWDISGKRLFPYSVALTNTYGSAEVNAVDIFEKSLNLHDVQIYKTERGANGEEKRVLDVQATMVAQEKQQKIKDAFQDWVWKNSDRRERLCKIYNETFNSIVPPSFSPDLVRFHGLNPLIELAPHQKESVARILFSGNTLLAHCVGAGKTWTMTAAAMEGKYLGLCQKSLIVVPNHLIGQWAAAIYAAYPQANVLASTEKDFLPANRKKYCSRIATGDYDIVVIGHSHFEKIPLSAERQEATIRKEMDDIVESISQLKESEGERFSIKKLEALRKSLQTKLERLHNSKKRDDVVTFEELGVDRLFVDESHNYKNLFLNTKMHNVAGVGQTDSQKASDMFVKCRYMDELTGGMGVIHGTGSPLSNTMAELYTTQRYLQYDLLQEMGLGNFDAWASTYGETVVALELAPEGNGYRPRTRFAKFFNLPELMNLYKLVADIRTKDMLNLPVPAVEYKTVVLKPSEDQKRIVRSFGDRAEKIRKGGVDNRKDNMLCVTNDGRKVALDQRLIDPTLPDDPNSKTAACAENIWNFYNMDSEKKLTQLVFCDLSTPKSDGFDVYNDLKNKLIAKGIPAEEIRFIHEANTTVQKEALFSKVRSGAVRVLMGSTGKMGTGTNVQDLLIAGHDLDAPWRPSDLEQRAGRVIRRGNENDLVYMVRYVTEGTFDAYMYQLLEIKQRFIDQVMTNKNPARCVDDIDGAALNYAEIKALSSGDPRIKEKVSLEMEISRLEVLKNRHVADQFYMEDRIKKLPGEIKGLQTRISLLEQDLAAVKSVPARTPEGKLIPAVVNGVTYEKQEETGLAIVRAVEALSNWNIWTTVGTLRGFRIEGYAYWSEVAGKKSLQVSIAGKCRYNIELHESGATIMLRLNNVLDNAISSRLDACRKELADCQAKLTEMQGAIGKPFQDEDLLAEKRARLANLDAALNLELQDKNKEKQSDSSEPEIVADGPVDVKPSLSDLIASAQNRTASSASGIISRGEYVH